MFLKFVFVLSCEVLRAGGLVDALAGQLGFQDFFTYKGVI